MKASQQARKQVKSAAPTSSLRQEGSSSSSSKKVHKELSSGAPRQSKQDQAQLPVKKLQTDRKSGKARERSTNDTATHQDHDATPVAAGPGAKRQVISSLFSNLQKVTPSESSQRDDVSASTTLLTPSNAPNLADSFGDMDISAEIVAHLKGKMSLSNPTTIQKLAVPFLCNPESSKKDALLQAQTGSGKTLAYLIPIIQDLCKLSEHFAKMGKPVERNVGTMAVVLVPTRELANQIFEVASKLLGFSSQAKASHRWITPGLLTGGAHRQHEKARLRKGVPLLIATVC
jgi:ATP-dependent RNA helicase DDX31/DBP7